MKALIIEDFTTKTGKILKIGDVIESEDGGIIHRLIEKGRARPLPSGAHGDAPSCPDEGSGEAPLPRGGEAPFPARFKAGDRVRFTYKTALDIREGVVLEAKWHPAPINRWWYRIETGGSKIWTSESHVQAAPGGSGSSNSDSEGGQ